jgi:hypothetical protein
MVVKQQKTVGGTTNCFTELKYWEKQGEKKEGEGAHLDSVLHLLHDHSTYHHLSISMN